MNGRLAQINNWAKLARKAKYRTNGLAKGCGMSTRELERFFFTAVGKTPHEWLNELRQMDALSLIRGGKSVKAAAIELGYRHPAHLSRDFKLFHGRPPSSARRLAGLRRPL